MKRIVETVRFTMVVKAWRVGRAPRAGGRVFKAGAKLVLPAGHDNAQREVKAIAPDLMVEVKNDPARD